MKNIEKYKDIVLDDMNICDIDTLLSEKCTKEYREFCEVFNCTGCKERFLKWLLEEAKEPVLDDAEKRYLSAVIRPFWGRVECIIKKTIGCEEHILIHLNGDLATLPRFKKGTIYKGMDADKWYSLEELGL